jgi:hypothetical protein
MSTLQSQLQALAASFAEEILNVIRTGSIEDLQVGGGWGSSGRSSRTDTPKAFGSSGAARKAVSERTATPPAKANGRLARRSADEIAATLDKIVLLVKTQKSGLRAEEIRTKLGLQAKEMPRILKDGLAKKKLTSKGQKRATTYFAK